MTEPERAYQDNLQLAKAEYLLQQVYSAPVRASSDWFSAIAVISAASTVIRRRMATDSSPRPGAAVNCPANWPASTPYLSTLDLMGGEVFLSPSRRRGSDGARPILRLTTNGTLLDDAWAERIVRTPFHHVTISIDADIMTNLVRSLTYIPIDGEVGRQAGAYLRQYRKSHGVEIADALIAAGALANRAELWTRDRKHYPMKEVAFFA